MNLIDRDALKSAFESMECVDHNRMKTTVAFGNGVRWMLNDVIPSEIGKAPIIDAAPVVHGEWMPDETLYSVFRRYKCSECGELTDNTCMEKPRYNFCPMCGAKMDGGKCNG